MANALTGQVAVISDMRDGWEELADESCPVLIGKLVRKNGMECYHTDAPLLVRWPALATRHGTSWWWNADDLSAQTIRAFDRTSDLPAGSSFIFPPRSRWATPPLTTEHPATLAQRMSAFTYHPLVYEAEGTADSALEGNDAAIIASCSARTFLQSKLLGQNSSVLHQQLHKEVLRDFATLGMKIRNKLRDHTAKTHKADSTRTVRALGLYVRCVWCVSQNTNATVVYAENVTLRGRGAARH